MQPWSAKTAAVGMLPFFLMANTASALEARRCEEEAMWGARMASVSPRGMDAWIGSKNSINVAVVRKASYPHAVTIDTGASVRIDFLSLDSTPGSNASPASTSKDASEGILEPDHKLEDAVTFMQLLDELEWKPDVWADDGEIAFEWIAGDKHAVVSFEGDGLLGYTLLRDGAFVSGQINDPPVSILPPDLKEYLSDV